MMVVSIIGSGRPMRMERHCMGGDIVVDQNKFKESITSIMRFANFSQYNRGALIMRTFLLAVFSLMFISGPVFADGHSLAKSGVIKFHTGWKCEYPSTAGTDDKVVGGVQCQGYTFSSDGSAALHEGPAGCYGAFNVEGNIVGQCSWSDADGDNLYTLFDGNAFTNIGTNNITGGTGKYAGMTGSGPWVCKGVATGESMCNQSLTYEIK